MQAPTHVAVKAKSSASHQLIELGVGGTARGTSRAPVVLFKDQSSIALDRQKFRHWCRSEPSGVCDRNSGQCAAASSDSVTRDDHQFALCNQFWEKRMIASDVSLPCSRLHANRNWHVHTGDEAIARLVQPQFKNDYWITNKLVICLTLKV